MEPERWELVKQLFDSVCELEPRARSEYLLRHAPADVDLHADVERLVSAWRASPDLLEHGVSATFLSEPIELPPDMIGKRVGAYQIDAVLARGGMGVVYRGRRADGQFEREVAIKVVNARLREGLALEWFARERSVLASLSHPHIVTLLDAGVCEGEWPFLVMEAVQGAPIDQHCRQHELDLRQRVRLVLDVCAAVQHAHRHLVVHGDLKPSNVLVDAHHGPKLLDFGVSRLLAADDAASPVRAPLSPAWASPEQFRGEPITTETDVYALGLLLQDLAADASGPRFLRDDLHAIACKASADDASARYASVEQFAGDVNRALRNEPLLARRATLADRLARLTRRHRLGVILGLVAAAAVAFGIVSSTASFLRMKDSERLAWQHHAQAVAVADVLQELLLACTRQWQPDAAAIVPLLDAQAARVQRDLEGHAEALGRVHFTLGHLYALCGKPDAAADHFAAADALAAESHGFSKADRQKYRDRLDQLRPNSNDAR